MLQRSEVSPNSGGVSEDVWSQGGDPGFKLQRSCFGEGPGRISPAQGINTGQQSAVGLDGPALFAASAHIVAKQKQRKQLIKISKHKLVWNINISVAHSQ